MGTKPLSTRINTHRRDQDEPVIPPQSQVGHPPGHQPQPHGEERKGEEDAEDGVHFRRLGRVEICFRLGCHVRRRTGTETSRGRIATRWISCRVHNALQPACSLIRVPSPSVGKSERSQRVNGGCSVVGECGAHLEMLALLATGFTQPGSGYPFHTTRFAGPGNPSTCFISDVFFRGRFITSFKQYVWRKANRDSGPIKIRPGAYQSPGLPTSHL